MSHSDDRPDVDPLQSFLRSLGHGPRLSKEQERDLGKRIRQGDEDAMRQMAEVHTPFVVFIASKYTSDRQLLLELIAAGNIGLMEAARRFDWKRECRFTTFAFWRIRYEISAVLSAGKSPVARIPQHMQARVTTYDAKQAAFLHQYGRWPMPEELAQLCGWRPEEVEEIARFKALYYTPPLSREDLWEGAGGTEPSEEDKALQREAEREQAESVRELRNAVAHLPLQQRHTVVTKYLTEQQALANREVAERLKTTPEAVKVNEHRARNTLRKLLGQDGAGGK